MDGDLNVTYITLGGYVEIEKYRYLYFVIMFTIYILIICSNSTIVCIIVIHQNLHEPMYIFIAALLINSVLFSTAIYPKLLVDFLSEKQIISYPLCQFQSFLFYALGGSEFFLLTAMSYDRYVSICEPLRYEAVMGNTSVRVLLSLSWLVPAAQLFPSFVLILDRKLCDFTLRGIFCNNSIERLHCVSSSLVSVYGVIVLLNVLVLPLLFIVFTYTKIFIVTYGGSRAVRSKAAQTCLPHLLVLVNFSFFCFYDVIIIRLESDLSKTARFIMTLQVVLYHPLFNPIIYGLKMKDINEHVKRLLCQRK